LILQQFFSVDLDALKNMVGKFAKIKILKFL